MFTPVTKRFACTCVECVVNQRVDVNTHHQSYGKKMRIGFAMFHFAHTLLSVCFGAGAKGQRTFRP
jgi:hypothetical protein